jgi:Lon protease-like protein
LADPFDKGPPDDGGLALALHRLPMFPLPDVVLFPHALLPLHIFEERYRAMTRDLLAGPRFLVIASILPGENDGRANPGVRPIAGVGRVVRADELPDGRFNLVVHGRARVHIDEEIASDLPYRLVAASPVPDLPITDDGELADAHQSLRALIDRLAESVPGGEHLRQMFAPQEGPAALVDALAATLIVEPGLRQRLLETRDVAKRIERVSAEVVAMTARIGSPTSLN